MVCVLSILIFFQQNWWPHGEVLGRVPGREGWHSDQGGDGVAEHPGVVVFRWEAPLFFANSGIFADQVREASQSYELTWFDVEASSRREPPVCGAAA